MAKTGESTDIVLFITTAGAEEAQRLADILLREKATACVNIVSGVNSYFWWQGKIEEAEECLLIVKSRRERLEPIVALVKAHHSYEVPEVIALPIIGGNPDYLKWLAEETG